MQIYIFTVVLLFVTACGEDRTPDEKTPSAPPQEAQNAQTGSSDRGSVLNTPPAQTVSPAAENSNNPPEQPGQNPPAEAPNADAVRTNSAFSRPQSTSQQVQSALNKIEGVYKFELDAYQEGWSNFWMHLVRPNTPVSMSLIQNKRPDTGQLLIYVLSEGDPKGQFCTIQSDFKLSHDFISDPISEAKMTAGRSLSNQGRIGDLYGVEGLIEIHSPAVQISEHIPAYYELWFLGQNDSRENAAINLSQRLENTGNFDSLCLSCGFEMDQNGLCQGK